MAGDLLGYALIRELAVKMSRGIFGGFANRAISDSMRRSLVDHANEKTRVHHVLAVCSVVHAAVNVEIARVAGVSGK